MEALGTFFLIHITVLVFHGGKKLSTQWRPVVAMYEEQQLIVVSAKCLEDAAAQFVPKQGRYHHVKLKYPLWPHSC